MKWRLYILVLAGLGMIYLVGLAFLDIPYPSPVGIQWTTRNKTDRDVSDQVILASYDNYIYKTHFVYEEENKDRNLVYDPQPLNIACRGHIIQSRQFKQQLLIPDQDIPWEPCFDHFLKGPIVQVSRNPNNEQWAVLYRHLENDHLYYRVRIYYFPKEKELGMVYKDILIPGTTSITAISLEDDMLFLHRDPDLYRFRMLPLPIDLTLEPHSENATVLRMSQNIPGDLIQVYDQPKRTEGHRHVLSGLYSANANMCRVFMFDIHKTNLHYYLNLTVTDKGFFGQPNRWIRQDHRTKKVSRMVENTVEYVGIMEDNRLYPEMIETQAPVPRLSRSKGAKTLVASAENYFYTLDYTDLPKYKSSSEGYLFGKDSVYGSGDLVYDSSAIVGSALDNQATRLAVWTETDYIYIYKRGQADHTVDSEPPLSQLPHHLENSLPWNFRMAVDPMDSPSAVGSVLFWEDSSGEHYISVGLKNNAVNTYFADRWMESKGWSFKDFLRERFVLVLVMVIVISLFAMNEYENYSL
ncbi:hypothetical protein BY458DRAFT_520734 [Sporodiniella umbellata]|nr:hypothetical protein BY458DRAFT_520734 [Sporodiniella umbellata]